MKNRPYLAFLVAAVALGCGGSVQGTPQDDIGFGGFGGAGLGEGGSGGDPQIVLTSTSTTASASTATSSSTAPPECVSNEDCDDGDPCTLDYCYPNGCSNPDATDATACGDAGHCFMGSCCESPGCFDPATQSCSDTCSNGKVCGASGVCVSAGG